MRVQVIGRRLCAVLLSAALPGLAASAQEPGLSSTDWRMPHDVSTEGWRSDWLVNVTIVFVAILFAIMVVWMLLACFRFRSKHEAVYSQGDSKRAVFLTVATAVAVFVCVDGNLFVNSTRDLHEVFWNFDLPAQRSDAVRIEINARQWAWDARYAGPDGMFNTADDIVTMNDIRVPVGSPVIFQLSATDVIHSLYIPNVRVKQDCVPGTITHAWFEAKETGAFDIACAQHCGVNHYKMAGKLTILPRAEFDQWASEASQNGVRAFDPDDRGALWGWPWQEI